MLILALLIICCRELLHLIFFSGHNESVEVRLIEGGLYCFGLNRLHHDAGFKEPGDLMPELLPGRGLGFTKRRQ